ncbi:hypothetical protein NFI96_015060 [Prochilodus magdalenae]|nr:hypothetical protein NFI96_015060 [Prochilodus magdalenae]
MTSFVPAFLLWLVVCTGSLSAQARIYMSVTEGSSAVLPCDWRNKTDSRSNGERLHIEWRAISETVFERRGEESYQGQGYEHRVDVPEDNLLSGDCSLVLRDVRLTDEGIYESFLLVRRKKRSLLSKRLLLQSVELSVDGKETALEHIRPHESPERVHEAEEAQRTEEGHSLGRATIDESIE